jgi:sugar phosphate isomerase/epimerase
MQLGISTYTYGWAVGVPGKMPEQPLTELDLLHKALDFGLHLVQFGDNLPLHTLPVNRLEALRQLALKSKITLEVGARGLTPEHLHRYILLCEDLGARLLRFVIDAPGYAPDLNEIIAIIQEQVPHLTNRNILLGLENHDRFKAREFACILDQVNSPQVGICLDSVNSMGAGEGLEQIVATLAPYTINLHVKDFGIQRLLHLMGFQIDGRPAGQGMLNIPWLLKQLAPFGRCRTAVLEQWVVPEPEIFETLRKEEAWASESVQYLKSYFET